MVSSDHPRDSENAVPAPRASVIGDSTFWDKPRVVPAVAGLVLAFSEE